MRINSRRLLGLSVVTKSRQELGKVRSIDIDTESGRLTTIRVNPRGLVKGLLEEELLVDWSQVISIDEDGLIVDDASVPEGAEVLATRATGGASVPSGAIFMEGETGEER
jgi:sporulation protein YlmC with PRC-barrel domain